KRSGIPPYANQPNQPASDLLPQSRANCRAIFPIYRLSLSQAVQKGAKGPCKNDSKRAAGKRGGGLWSISPGNSGESPCNSAVNGNMKYLLLLAVGPP